jgi:hypothetical protein
MLVKPSTFRSFSLDITCGSLAFSKDLSSINHARNFVREDGIFSKDVPRETWIKFMRMSSIVFSSSLTIADAIAAAAKLKSILKVTEFEQGMSAACSEMSEEQVQKGHH